jgi:septal ring factor EnvC (AmiA/AmiB activator)
MYIYSTYILHSNIEFQLNKVTLEINAVKEEIQDSERRNTAERANLEKKIEEGKANSMELQTLIRHQEQTKSKLESELCTKEDVIKKLREQIVLDYRACDQKIRAVRNKKMCVIV